MSFLSKISKAFDEELIRMVQKSLDDRLKKAEVDPMSLDIFEYQELLNTELRIHKSNTKKMYGIGNAFVKNAQKNNSINIIRLLCHNKMSSYDN